MDQVEEIEVPCENCPKLLKLVEDFREISENCLKQTERALAGWKVSLIFNAVLASTVIVLWGLLLFTNI